VVGQIGFWLPRGFRLPYAKSPGASPQVGVCPWLGRLDADGPFAGAFLGLYENGSIHPHLAKVIDPISTLDAESLISITIKIARR
jgi:hypothetical protein